MNSKRLKAFTFIEVVVALAIVSIALIGLLHLHLVSIRTADKAQTMAHAVLLAQEKTTQTLCGGFPRAGTASGTVEISGSRLDWRTEVTDVERLQPYELGRSALRHVRTIVAWREGAGQASIETSTYIADSKIHE